MPAILIFDEFSSNFNREHIYIYSDSKYSRMQRNGKEDEIQGYYQKSDGNKRLEFQGFGME